MSIAEWTLLIKVLSNQSLPIVLHLFPSFLGLINYSISPDVGRCRLGVELKDEDNSNEVEDKVEIKDFELRKKQNSTHVLSHMLLISVVHSQSRKSSALPMGYQWWDLNKFILPAFFLSRLGSADNIEHTGCTFFGDIGTNG